VEAGKHGFGDAPDPGVIDHRVAVDQDIPKPDDLAQMRHAPRKVRFESWFNDSPMISNWRSTAERTSAFCA